MHFCTNKDMKDDFGKIDFDSLFEDMGEEGADTTVKETPENIEEDAGLTDTTQEEVRTDSIAEEDVEKQEALEEESEEEFVEVLKEVETNKKDEYRGQEVFSNLARKYIEIGSWKDAKIEINGEEVVLSEVGDLDEETFLEIQIAQEGLKQADLKDKYINKDELDEVGLQILEISKEGGDWNKILQIKQRYIDPLENYDLKNPNHQEALVREKLFLNSGSTLSKADLDSLIDTRKRNLTLDTEASEYAGQVKEAFYKYAEAEKQKAINDKNEVVKRSNELKTKTKTVLKGYNLADNAINPMLDLISHGDNDAITGHINTIKSNPEVLAELVFFLSRPEDYKKYIVEKGTRGKSTEVLRTLNMIPKGSQGRSHDIQEEKKTGRDLDKELNLRFV